MATKAATTKVLFVCTGNQCRSPMAEGLARATSDEISGVVFRSAGFVEAGRPPTTEAIEVMADLGVDISSHRSALVKDVIGSDPDLIICMTRQHLRSTVEIEPSALSRTFTLAQIVEVARHGERPENESPLEFLRRRSTRNIPQLAKAHTHGDIADPIGKSIDAYRHCASKLSQMVNIASAALWPTDKMRASTSSGVPLIPSKNP